MGAKRRLNGTSKVNTHTDGHTDRRTFQLIESIGPEGRCLENWKISCSHLKAISSFCELIYSIKGIEKA